MKTEDFFEKLCFFMVIVAIVCILIGEDVPDDDSDYPDNDMYGMDFYRVSSDVCVLYIDGSVYTVNWSDLVLRGENVPISAFPVYVEFFCDSVAAAEYYQPAETEAVT